MCENACVLVLYLHGQITVLLLDHAWRQEGPPPRLPSHTALPPREGAPFGSPSICEELHYTRASQRCLRDLASCTFQKDL